MASFFDIKSKRYGGGRRPIFITGLCLLAIGIWRYTRSAHTRTAYAYCPWCDDPLLCRRKFLFIIASGRSGSSTLMSMVNSVPDFFLSGENGDAAFRLLDIYQARTARQCISSNEKWKSRSCAASRRQELVDIQGWLWESNAPAALPGPDAVVGFKEIYWTDEMAAFVQDVAPCSRFILNLRRNASNQAQSGFFSQSNDPAQKVKDATDRAVSASHKVSQERLYAFDLEDFSLDNFYNLSKWLGRPCRFFSVVHSNANGTYTPGAGARCIEQP